MGYCFTGDPRAMYVKTYSGFKASRGAGEKKTVFMLTQFKTVFPLNFTTPFQLWPQNSNLVFQKEKKIKDYVQLKGRVNVKCTLQGVSTHSSSGKAS